MLVPRVDINCNDHSDGLRNWSLRSRVRWKWQKLEPMPDVEETQVVSRNPFKWVRERRDGYQIRNYVPLFDSCARDRLPSIVFIKFLVVTDSQGGRSSAPNSTVNVARDDYHDAIGISK